MSNELKNPSLTEAAEKFLLTLLGRERTASRTEIHKFVSWFGANHPLSGLTGAEIAHYADRVTLSHADHAVKLEPIRAFLAYAKKQGWTKNNLSTNVKARKTSNTRTLPVHFTREPTDVTQITQQGLDDLKAELEELVAKRPGLIDEIQRAAADKDFRENVPLHAAREARGHLEGRIMELEVTLKTATVIDEHARSARRVNVGDTVVLCHLEKDVELRFTLVSPREVDAAHGKISCVSPLGQAIVNQEQGDTVEVVAPAGRSRYKIKKVEH
jgi:transcription elongation factor GreA